LGAHSPAAIAANGDSTLAGTTWTSHVLLFMSLLFFRFPFSTVFFCDMSEAWVYFFENAGMSP